MERYLFVLIILFITVGLFITTTSKIKCEKFTDNDRDLKILNQVLIQLISLWKQLIWYFTFKFNKLNTLTIRRRSWIMAILMSPFSFVR